MSAAWWTAWSLTAIWWLANILYDRELRRQHKALRLRAERLQGEWRDITQEWGAIAEEARKGAEAADKIANLARQVEASRRFQGPS